MVICGPSSQNFPTNVIEMGIITLAITIREPDAGIRTIINNRVLLE
jgi:hypothetical protein